MTQTEAQTIKAVNEPAVVRPYGLLGLILSFVGICCLAALLIGAAAGIWFFVAGEHAMQADMAAMGLHDINEIRKAPHHVQMVFYSVVAVTFIAFGLATLAFARLRGGRQWREPLFWGPSTGWSTGRSPWILLVLAPVYLLVVGYGIKLIFPEFRTWFFVPQGIAGIALSFVTVVLLAPWAEELVFRGWIYSSLRQSFGIAAGVIVTAVLFALAHTDATGLYPVLVFIPGLVMTLIREKNGSAKASFLAHAAYNCMAWLIVFFVGNS